MPTAAQFIHQYTIHPTRRSIIYVHIRPMQGDIHLLKHEGNKLRSISTSQSTQQPNLIEHDSSKAQ